ncbi:MAG: protein-export chaperone SecB [Bacteroidia bacterium]|nr:protein-export chaperone SecB [Bacteroidia bacterium]
MNEIKPAAFSFEKFEVINFSYSKASNSTNELKLELTPSGVYESLEGVFRLKFDFYAYSQDKETSEIKATIMAYFLFEDKPDFNELPPYFYNNSMALVFPYLRAFISTLTLQANVTPIILPVINLTGFESELKENTVEE